MPPILTSSYHTHNRYCDGQGQIEEVIEAAIEAGLAEIGISSHAPLPFETDWTMPEERFPAYLREVRELQGRYAGRIGVLLGAEIDFIPHPRVAAFQANEIVPAGFDYFVGSVHFLGADVEYPPPSFDGTEEEFRLILHQAYEDDMAAMAADYYGRVRRMLAMPGLRIVAHLDLIKRWNAKRAYFCGDEPWYVEAVEATLQAISGSGHVVELNTSGWREGVGEPYPAPWVLARCRDLGIPVTVSSDAHTPAEVTWGFDRALDCLAGLGIEPATL